MDYGDITIDNIDQKMKEKLKQVDHQYLFQIAKKLGFTEDLRKELSDIFLMQLLVMDKNNPYYDFCLTTGNQLTDKDSEYIFTPLYLMHIIKTLQKAHRETFKKKRSGEDKITITLN